MSMLYVTLFLGVALIPVYAFSSGGVQPAHLFLAIFTITMISRFGLKLQLWSWFLLSLSVWVFFREATQGVILGGDANGLTSFLYFFYNFIVSCTVAQYVEKEGDAPVIFGIMVAAFIALLSSVMNGVNLETMSDYGRETGSFNNPNQLGFFSVCLLSLSYFFYASEKCNYLVALLFLSIALFLSVLSLSKAAMIANGMVVFFALAPKVGRLKFSVFMTIAIAVVFFAYLFIEQDVLDNLLFLKRLTGMMDEDDSSLVSRGYFIFLTGNAFDLLFGLGSVSIETILGHEVHSTFASVLNNFGVFGLAIFLAFFLTWGSKVYIHFGVIGLLCIVCPPFVYGITHNGSRFVIFWILVATTFGYINSCNKKT